MFNIITLNNWTTVVMIANTSNDDAYWIAFTVILHISWIIIGNYVFLNLFLAILLDGFDENTIEI